MTMGNPGTSVGTSTIGVFDVLCIYESSGYPSLSFITYAGYPKSDFAVIAFGVGFNAGFVTNSFPLVAWEYLDNLSGGNPYYTLSSLFMQDEAALSVLDAAVTTTTSTSTSSSSVTTTASSTSTSTSTTPA